MSQAERILVEVNTSETGKSPAATQTARAPTTVNPYRLLETMFGFAPALILDTGIECGIFDALTNGPKTKPEIAQMCSVAPRSAGAILNALVGLEWLTKNGESYSLTDESAALLVKGSPGYHGGMLRHIVGRLLPAWQSLDTTMRTGKPAIPLNIEGEGGGCFRDFVAALYSANVPAAQTLAREFLGVRAQTRIDVLDIAAGSGVWGIALALASANVHVTAVDWEQVIPVTRQTTAKMGVEDRFRFVAGDVHEAAFGSGYDLAVLGHILHTQGAIRGRSLVRKTFEALSPGGTIVVAEVLVNDDKTGPLAPLIFAVNMLVTTDEGDTFSLGEITEWLSECGLRNVRTLDVPGSSPLILADK
jgi:hypothetical protein